MIKLTSRILILLIISVLPASIFISKISASNSENTATTSIEKAENALASAYQAILEVEQIGANVSDLLAQLNEAGEFLAEAHIAYKLGNFDDATNFANQSKSIGEKLKNDAYELKESAWRENIQRMWLTIMGSVLGVILIASGSLWTWHFLKRRYP